MIQLLIGTAYAADAPKAAGGGTFPPFDPTWYASTVFWLLITFGLVYFLMSKIALPRVEDILEARASRIDGDLAAATEMQDKAKSAGEAYEKLLADARANAQGIGQKAKDEAAADAEARRKAVEADVAKKVASSEASIADARNKAMSNVSGIASDAAGEIVKRITGVAPKADDLKSAVSAARA
ncbi:MAG: F0F1 ATP synthase subunit B' [Beijerinckiaceae bacterium]